MQPLRTRIIDVQRKPMKCPYCGLSVVDLIYGTGDMIPIEYVFEYRREGVPAGDYIPRNPPIWACTCCSKRFRKVLADGSPAPIKVKMLQRVRKKPATLIHWTHTETEKELNENRSYLVTITTELGETETLSVSARNEEKAEELVIDLVGRRMVGLRGVFCRSVTVKEDSLGKGR